MRSFALLNCMWTFIISKDRGCWGVQHCHNVQYRYDPRSQTKVAVDELDESWNLCCFFCLNQSIERSRTRGRLSFKLCPRVRAKKQKHHCICLKRPCSNSAVCSRPQTETLTSSLHILFSLYSLVSCHTMLIFVSRQPGSQSGLGL